MNTNEVPNNVGGIYANKEYALVISRATFFLHGGDSAKFVKSVEKATS